MSDEIIKPTNTCDNKIAPPLSHIGNKRRVTFDGSCLKEDKLKFAHETIVNIYIFVIE